MALLGGATGQAAPLQGASQRTVLRYGCHPASTSTARDHPQAGGRSRRRCPPQQPQPEADWHGAPAVEHAPKFPVVGAAGADTDGGHGDNQAAGAGVETGPRVQR